MTRWRRRASLGLVACLAATTGCHTLDFELAEGPRAEARHHQKSFFLFGVFPREMHVDVSQYCPAGVAAVREQTTLEDGVAALVTAGLWTPRSSWYTCTDANPETETPGDATGPAAADPPPAAPTAS